MPLRFVKTNICAEHPRVPLSCAVDAVPAWRSSNPTTLICESASAGGSSASARGSLSGDRGSVHRPPLFEDEGLTIMGAMDVWLKVRWAALALAVARARLRVAAGLTILGPARGLQGMLVAQIPMSASIRLWDTYLSKGFWLHTFVCVAILSPLKHQLELEQQTVQTCLNNVPITHVDEVVVQAENLASTIRNIL